MQTPGARIVVATGDVSNNWDLTDQDQEVLRSLLSQVWMGKITPSDSSKLAATLGKAFIFFQGTADAIELRSSQPWLLTDVPWEFAHIPKSGNAGSDRLGDFPLLRVVNLDQPRRNLAARPTILIAVAQLSGNMSVPILPGQYVPSLNNVLRSAPPFQVVCELGAEPLRPLYAENLFAAVGDFDPDVVILVAHGKADPPTVYFEDDASSDPFPKAIAVSELAARLGKARMVVLLCCDLTRSTGGPSAALSLVASGVPEAVTMQGEIPQNLAAAFVKRTLVSLHRAGGLGEAVRAGRQAIGNSPFALTPVGFSGLGADGSLRRWEEAREAYDAALKAFLPAVIPSLPRPSLDRCIEQWLDTLGCRLVAAPFDPTGQSIAAPFAAYLTKQASTHLTEPRRPTLILDFRAPAGSQEDPAAQPWDLLFDRLVGVLSRAEALLPAGSSPAPRATVQSPTEAADLLIDLIDRTGVAVLVIRAHADGTSVDFWKEVMKLAAARLEKGALLISPAPDAVATFEKLFAGDKIEIPPLGYDEVGELFRSQLQSAGITAESLVAKTAGNPLILHAVMEATRGGSGITIDQLAIKKAQSIADAFGTVLLAWTREEQLPTLLCLCFIEEPASESALIDLLPAAVELLTRLSTFGFFTKIPHDKSASQQANLLYPVKEFAEFLRDRIQRDHAGALAAMAGTLLERLPNVQAVARLIASPGGLAAIAMAQTALDCGSHVETDQSRQEALAKRAFELGLWASESEQGSEYVSRHFLLDMMQRTREIGENWGAPLADVLLGVAIIAHSIGEEDHADEALRAFHDLDDLPLELRVKAEWLAADRMKDLGQARSRDQALEHLAQARRLLLDVSENEISREVQASLLNDILYTTMKLSFFLQNRDVDQLPPLVQELVDHPTNPLEHAVVLCTFAEQEMRQDNPDWNRIGGWCNKAESLLTDPAGLANLRAYCTYQIAQAFRRRPVSDPVLAAAFYEQTAELARTGGDVAREGLAVCRRAELLQNDASLGGTNELAKLDLSMAEIVRRLMSRGGAVGLRHALDARALVRLHRMRAQLASTPAQSADHHRAAAVASKAPLLGSQRDLQLLADSARQFLSTSLAIGGRILAVRSFTSELEATLQSRLGISVDRDHPETLLSALESWKSSEQANI